MPAKLKIHCYSACQLGCSTRGLTRLPLCILLASLSCIASARGETVKAEADRLKMQQLEIAQQLVRDFPNTFSAVQILANVYKTQGNHHAFLECLQQCATLAPQRSDVHEQLGIQLLELEDYAAAVRHFRTSLSLRRQASVQIRLANSLLQVGELEEAQQILESVSQDDSTGEASYLLGELRFQQQDVSAAQVAFQQALQRQPNHLKALYGMVKTSIFQDDPEATRQYSEKFGRLQTMYAALNQQRRDTYDDLSELRRNTAQTFTDAGRTYHRRDRIPTAEQLWRRAAEMDLKNTTCRVLLARHYEATQQYDRTIELYWALIDLQPTHLATYERLGIRLASNGDFAGAEKIFQAMCKVPSNPARGFRMLAKLYLNSDRQTEKALQLAKQSVEQDPVADSYFVLGWALMKNQQNAAARVALRRAMELDDSNALYGKLYNALPPETP